MFIFLCVLILVALLSSGIIFALAPPQWMIDTFYPAGALVTFEGKTFQSIHATFSLMGFEPPKIPNVWRFIPAPPSPVVGGPLPGLTPAQLARFNAGRAQFIREFEVREGLGPAMNSSSCQICHDLGNTGGGGIQLETRVGRVMNGMFDPLENQGGEVLQALGIGGLVPGCLFTGEHVPENANEIARRRSIPLFGDGLVDATSPATLQAIANSQPPGVRGRLNMVTEVATGMIKPGKFGWKAQNPTLFQFAGDALLNELGITNPQFPTENPPQGQVKALRHCDRVPDPEDCGGIISQKIADFMMLLAPPPRGPITPEVQAGEVLFDQFGCEVCHVDTITSSPNPIAALSNKTFHPYSDFLLHEMGDLGDGIPDQGIATGREMRTQPLWGLRFVDQDSFLHNGEGHTLTQAILLHDGQGAASRDAFAAATPAQQNAVLAFLESL
jgi:CxxC motif-containing protein (DUF1111 family)